MNEKDTALQVELLEAFTETEQWQEELTNNPDIVAAINRLKEAAEALGYEPNGPVEKLLSAALLYGDAVTKTAFLYGMRIGDVLRHGQRDPERDRT